jgi:hypothetical protein
MAVTSCHYSPLAPSTPNISYRPLACNNLLKIKGKQLNRNQHLEILSHFWQQWKLSHDVSQLGKSNSTIDLQTWLYSIPSKG